MANNNINLQNAEDLKKSFAERLHNARLMRGLSMQQLCDMMGNLLVKKDPAFDTRNYGFKKLSSLIEAYPSYFDLSKVNNSHLIVRENEIKEVGNSPPLIWRFSKNQNICLINLYFVSIPHCTCHFRP